MSKYLPAHIKGAMVFVSHEEETFMVAKMEGEYWIFVWKNDPPTWVTKKTISEQIYEMYSDGQVFSDCRLLPEEEADLYHMAAFGKKNEWLDLMKKSTVDHPDHYNQVPGIECIDVVENFNFNIGNAVKYLWRAGYKGNLVEDLEKARWYVDREIERVRKGHE